MSVIYFNTSISGYHHLWMQIYPPANNLTWLQLTNNKTCSSIAYRGDSDRCDSEYKGEEVLLKSSDWNRMCQNGMVGLFSICIYSGYLFFLMNAVLQREPTSSFSYITLREEKGDGSGFPKSHTSFSEWAAPSSSSSSREWSSAPSSSSVVTRSRIEWTAVGFIFSTILPRTIKHHWHISLSGEISLTFAS